MFQKNVSKNCPHFFSKIGIFIDRYTVKSIQLLQISDSRAETKTKNLYTDQPPRHKNSGMDDVAAQENSFISLAQASEQTGYHQDYLGFLARTGKLRAQKIGRNWVTTQSAINELLANGNTELEAAPTKIERNTPAAVTAQTQSETVQSVPALASMAPEDAQRLAALSVTTRIKSMSEKVATAAATAATAAFLSAQAPELPHASNLERVKNAVEHGMQIDRLKKIGEEIEHALEDKSKHLKIR